jgi:hypothetical protein
MASRRKKHPFFAKLVFEGRHIHLGVFKTAEEAHEAWVKAHKQYHGEVSNAR